MRHARWRHGPDGGLSVLRGHRLDEVPAALADRLTTQGPLTADASDDLLLLEAQLRHDAADASAQVDAAERRIASLRSEAPVDRRALEQATAEQVRAVEVLQQARDHAEQLREFVMRLDVPDGPLRAAADGWRRSPAIPAHVTVFDDETSFLAVDARRAVTTGLGMHALAGVEEWGWAWRRDGDDDDLSAPLQPDRCGQWVLGYLPATEEVYAVLRGTRPPSRIWLLGRDFDRQAAYTTLDDLAARMPQPNSLIAAAQVIHAATLWRPRDHGRLAETGTAATRTPSGEGAG